MIIQFYIYIYIHIYIYICIYICIYIYIYNKNFTLAAHDWINKWSTHALSKRNQIVNRNPLLNTYFIYYICMPISISSLIFCFCFCSLHDLLKLIQTNNPDKCATECVDICLFIICIYMYIYIYICGTRISTLSRSRWVRELDIRLARSSRHGHWQARQMCIHI